MKKSLSFIITLALLVLFSLPSFAYSSAPYLVIECDIDSIPSETAYVDLLLPISQNDENYISKIENEKTVE